MEHASVAAFARFVLELLALGAPAELVEDAQQALADELEHTRLAFGLASAYQGKGVGPGPLPTAGVMVAAPLVEVVRTAFLEACVGETCAVIEAERARAAATDPVVIALLDRIATDELRHAALGYRFVKWALAVAAPADQAALYATLRRELDALALRAARDVSIREIVLPCAQALLDERTTAAA
jgi:hypothetical protein